MSVVRCQWARNPPFPEYEHYHDREWGVPVHDDRRLFEFLTLEGAQAGLSWATILKKREHYRQPCSRSSIPSARRPLHARRGSSGSSRIPASSAIG